MPDESTIPNPAADSTSARPQGQKATGAEALWPPRQPGAGTQPQGNAELIMNIPVEVQVVLGATTMPVATLMNLGRGAVITLDKQIGDPIDIVVNGRVVARGEVIVMEDDSSRFGVSLTEVIGK
ncbi:MAG: Flagellar motor switch protein FliN [Candidatus Tokpelaia hoelldobleri]|uniref:Flagellar motor switch protein FliN n=1 Tax=Candidatus Tokpelaia hoelldobleri TaxID=1902579 RepID=A0A1U9JSU8_9HYPH|nr:MAG: Flagellar motor switch protein FliN [Candidatus Tokpelaia hoelldoblerii]